jgi:hypothetical protein
MIESSDEPIRAAPLRTAPLTPDEAIAGEGFTLMDAGLLGAVPESFAPLAAVLPTPEPLAERMVPPYLPDQVYPTPGAGGGVLGVPPLKVEEEDGTPSVTGVDLVKVPNGTLTDLGSGDVRLNYESPINKNVANGYAGLDAGSKVAAAQVSEVLELADLSDVAAKTGTGTTVVMQGSPTLTTPTIADLTNAQHGHQGAAGGGTLDAAAIASGTMARARLPGEVAYEDESNAFTQLNRFKDVGLDDQDPTPMADRRLRTIDGKIKATDTSQVEGRHISRASLEQIDLTQDVTGALPIANGGTGQTAVTPAFDALAPTTAKGDLIVHDGADNVKIAAGANGQVLTADDAQTKGLKWATPVIPDVYEDGVSVVADATVVDFKDQNVEASGTQAQVYQDLPSLCEGRLTLSSGNPVYTPIPKTPSSTNTGADTVDFASAHGWTTGTMVTPSATGGGLTAGTTYYINAVDADTVSFHTTLANAEAGTPKVDLTASITAELRPLGVARTTLYFAPYKGSKVSLHDGTRWKKFAFTERSLSLSLTSGKNYDVFVYNNGGTLTLELSAAWTNDTARADALALQDGVYVKSGATTRRYLGTLRAVGTNEAEDSQAKRFVWNYYNRVKRFLKVVEGTNSWTYTSVTWRQANGSAANQVDLVIGISEDAVYVLAKASLSGNISNGTAGVGIGVSSTTVNSASAFSGHVGTGSTLTAHNLTAVYLGYPGIGRFYFAWMEAASNGTQTHTWYGDNGNDREQNGLVAELLG